MSAIVLAGGRASRFGGDKLAALIDGRPLLHHAIEAVATVADEVIVVVAPEGARDLPHTSVPVRQVHDDRPFLGPLAGIGAGAVAAEHPTLLVVAGDMPSLVPGVLRLLTGAIAGDTTAAVLGDPEPDGPPHPLPLGLARAAAIPVIAALLAADRRSLMGLITALDATRVHGRRWRALDPDARTLQDVDRPEDLPGR